MKKMIFSLVALVAMALGFTSCHNEVGLIEIQYGFVDDATAGITHGPAGAYLVADADLYQAFETAFKSESGYQSSGLGACKLNNKDKIGYEGLVFALAVKGAANVPADFSVPETQADRQFKVIYRFVGEKTGDWKTAWEWTYK